MDESLVSLANDCQLKGTIANARNSDIPIHAFKGVPYAVPPVGKRRFMPPETFPLWDGVREATQYGPVCPQNRIESSRVYYPLSFPDNASDDCIYLNVWTPSLKTASKLPVMVWIYGGTFQVGFSNYYDGTAMAARQNVVFVSFNYRVGAFGFLCTGDGVVSGNMGLLDQVEALRWVQRHIEQFGGDPDNVTVFGESAGSISISHLIVSPLSRGMHRSAPEAKSLFRRAICQSGVCLHPGSMIQREQARKFLHKRLPAMGSTLTDSKDILKFLQSLPVEQIVKHLYLFSFVIKDDVRFPDPHEIYKNGKCNPVDLMLGVNSHEGAQFIVDLARGHSVTSRQHAEDILTRIVKVMFYRGHPSGDAIFRALREEYLDSAGDDITKLTQALVELHGDLLFYAPTMEKTILHSKYASTYLYNYEYRMSLSTYPEWIIADHGQEVPLMIGEPFLERFPDVWQDEDKHMSDTIMTLWSNFAKNGIPSCPGQPDWPQFKHDRQCYLNLAPGSSSLVKSNFKTSKVNFWTDHIASIVKKSSPVHASKY